MNGKIGKEDLRPAVVAGAFYPGDPRVLDKEVDSFLEKAESKKIQGEIKALISPHAGYMYSGQVAAEGYKQLEGKDYRVVAIIAPSHREYFPGASVFNGGGFQTPLGTVPVDRALADTLTEQHGQIVSSWAGHREEHSLEVQIPFLQKVLKDFKIVPIVMGEQHYQTCQILGEALAKVLQGQKALIVASTDLSHFHPYQEAVRLDNLVIERVKALDYQGLSEDLDARISEACGGGPVIAAMIASQKLGADRSQILQYKNSGDVTGDRSGVVGYLSAVLYKTAV